MGFRRDRRHGGDSAKGRGSVDDQAHSWWADRDEIEAVPVGRPALPVIDLTESERHSRFADEYPVESLFEYTPSDDS